ncbi:MAG: hypothetical protein JRF15_14115 [Deltaproteobacteria bacterium]|nr:hypothetical protein [Deltaproteobacteria bacterium]
MREPRITSLLALWIALLVSPAFAGTTASFQYPLASFSGPVESLWARLAVDPERNEIYTLRQRNNDIRIYDEHGMEIFVFGEGVGSATDITVGNGGDLFLLTRGYQTATVQLLNYRGEHVADIPLKNVPRDFAGIVPDRIQHQNGLLYLVDSNEMKVIVVDEAGRFEKGYDLGRAIKPFIPREKARRELSATDWRALQLNNIDLNGFTVDAQGNLFFTVPVLFRAFKLSTHGELTDFGKAGSGLGKFGVIAGIATDEFGYVYVSDRLRSVILVFNSDLVFQTEFGYRGNLPSNLIVPDDLAIDGNGNLYVGQAAYRGVSVFKVVHRDTSFSRVIEATPINEVETSDRNIEEVEVSHPEFAVDLGSDEASTDSGDSSRNTEAVGSPNNEEGQNE